MVQGFPSPDTQTFFSFMYIFKWLFKFLLYTYYEYTDSNRLN